MLSYVAPKSILQRWPITLTIFNMYCTMVHKFTCHFKIFSKIFITISFITNIYHVSHTTDMFPTSLCKYFVFIIYIFANFVLKTTLKNQMNVQNTMVLYLKTIIPYKLDKSNLSSLNKRTYTNWTNFLSTMYLWLVVSFIVPSCE